MAKEQRLKQPTRRNLEPGQVRDLYMKCASKESQLSASGFVKLQQLLIKEVAFPKLFPPDPKVPPDPRESPSAARSVDVLVYQGHKYGILLKLLERAPDNESSWWALARWLRDEGIQQPEDLLPDKIFRRLTAGARKRLQGFRWTDFRYAGLVDAWLPYSEALLSEKKRLRLEGSALEKRLRELGYRSSFISVAAEKPWRSAVEFTCQWLDERGGHRGMASTLRNAHSRILGKKALSKLPLMPT